MPYCQQITGKCSFEEGSAPCDERTSSGCACIPPRIHCPILRQNGHCGQSAECKGCNRLK